MQQLKEYPLAVIIVAYKSEAMTINFVKEQTTKISTPHKVIIVNNGATSESNNKYAYGLNVVVVDNESCEVKKEQDASVYIINNPNNSGFAIGNNMGAEFAKRNFNSKYFLFSNNDIRFADNDVVEKLIAKLELHPEVGIIGPMVRGLNGDYQSPEPYVSFADKYIWVYLSTPFLSKKRKMERFHLDYADKAKEGYHYRLMGSFFIVPSEAYFDCGMMDEHTFLFAEEMILSERMASVGKKVYYDPEVTVFHAHGTTIKKAMPSKRMQNIQFESNAYYYHRYRHVSCFEVFLVKFLNRLIQAIMKITKK